MQMLCSLEDQRLKGTPDVFLRFNDSHASSLTSVSREISSQSWRTTMHSQDMTTVAMHDN